MTLLERSEPWTMTAAEGAQRKGFAAASELALRNAMEDLLRGRFVDARMCHEMVMGEGRVRADLVAVAPTHIAAVEVKGPSDDTVRLLHQVGMYALCVPEVWMVVDASHGDDARLIRHLMPAVGLITGEGLDRDYYGRRGEIGTVTLAIKAEAVPRPVVPEMALQMLWAAELRSACHVLHIADARWTAKAVRKAMIDALVKRPWPEVWAAICEELRNRDALWRADPVAGTRKAPVDARRAATPTTDGGEGAD